MCKETNNTQIFKKICDDEKLIIDLNYHGKNYWKKAKEFKSCFVDGGVYSNFLSSTAPFAIRGIPTKAQSVPAVP